MNYIFVGGLYLSKMFRSGSMWLPLCLLSLAQVSMGFHVTPSHGLSACGLSRHSYVTAGSAVRTSSILGPNSLLRSTSLNRPTFRAPALRMSATNAHAPTIEEEILRDHEELRQYYEQYRATRDMKWYNQFVWELCRHSVGEEIVVYPLLDSLGDTGRELADEARQEHRTVKEMLTRMEHLAPGGPDTEFDVQFAALMTELTAHMDKEERTDLPLIKDMCNVEDRMRYGRRFENRKKIVPTRPHTSAPEKPAVLEEVMGLFIAPLDKFRDLFREFPEEV